MAAYEINRNYATRICSFVIDTSDDLSSLPTSDSSGTDDLKLSTPCRMGSRAFCIKDGSTYMLNGNNEWATYTPPSGGGGGGSGGSSDSDVEEEIEPIDDSTIESLFG